jgi:nickel transport protein
MMPERLTAKAKRIVYFAGLFLGIMAIVILLAPATTRAHGVSVFAYAEGDTVLVDGYFHDGAKCKDCMVEAFDSHDSTVAKGKTDASGKFSFTAPARIDMVIRLSDPVGHLAEYRLPASDLPESLPAASGELEIAAGTTHAHSHAPTESGTSVDAQNGKRHDPTEIEQMVEKAVARQLEPVRRAMEESGRRRRISDVIGGIGYIVGLMGIILYFRSKRQQ